MGRWILGTVLTGLLASTGWLLVENRELRAVVVRLEANAGAVGVTPAPVAQVVAAPGDGAAKRLLGLAARLGGTSPAAPSSASSEPVAENSAEAPAEDRAARRARRQARIMDMFGRLPGESEEEYRARVQPLVETVLAMQRPMAEETRRAAEFAANVTDAQRQTMDAVLSDAYTEAMALANQAIQSGDVSPYRRSATGVLTVMGGMGAILSTAETRLGGVLSADQRTAMQDAGFDLVEYLGVTAPWENLDVPPPPP